MAAWVVEVMIVPRSLRLLAPLVPPLVLLVWLDIVEYWILTGAGASLAVLYYGNAFSIYNTAPLLLNPRINIMRTVPIIENFVLVLDHLFLVSFWWAGSVRITRRCMVSLFADTRTNIGVYIRHAHMTYLSSYIGRYLPTYFRWLLMHTWCCHHFWALYLFPLWIFIYGK